MVGSWSWSQWCTERQWKGVFQVLYYYFLLFPLFFISFAPTSLSQFLRPFFHVIFFSLLHSFMLDMFLHSMAQLSIPSSSIFLSPLSHFLSSPLLFLFTFSFLSSLLLFSHFNSILSEWYINMYFFFDLSLPQLLLSFIGVWQLLSSMSKKIQNPIQNLNPPRTILRSPV